MAFTQPSEQVQHIQTVTQPAIRSEPGIFHPGQLQPLETGLRPDFTHSEQMAHHLQLITHAVTRTAPALLEGVQNASSSANSILHGGSSRPIVDKPVSGNRQSKSSKSSANHKSRVNQTSIKAAFKELLRDQQERSIIRLLEDGNCDKKSNGLPGWDVLDVPQWWETVKEWYRSRHDVWTEKTFFMALRRMGYQPYNLLRPTVSSSYDFRLERTDVSKHGYIFNLKMWERYNRPRLLSAPADD